MDVRGGMTSRLLPSLLSRLTTRLLALLAAVTALLFLLRAAPGDAVDLVTTNDQLRSRMADAWELDTALPVAVGRALTGAWGTSWTVRPGQPVANLMGDGLQASLPVLGGAFLLMILAGLGLGVRSADRGSIRPSVSVLPVFLLGWSLVIGLNELAFSAMRHGWIDRPAWFSLPDTPSLLRYLLSIAVLATGSGNVRAFSRGVSQSLSQHRASAAIEALTARGMPTSRVLWRLVLADVAALTAERTAYLFGGLVVLERVFAMPGLGNLFFEACVQRDQPVVLASGVLAAAAVVGLRFAADGLRLLADPRLRETT